MQIRMIFCATLVVVTVQPTDSADAQLFKKRNKIEAGEHQLALTGTAARQTTIDVVKLEDEKSLQVKRAELLNLPMEYLAIPTDIADGAFVPPGNRFKEKPLVVKALLKIAGKAITEVSERAGFLDDFVASAPCFDTSKNTEVPFATYLATYVDKQGYIKDGYFTKNELKQTPGGALAKLLLIDRWILYEAKLIQSPSGKWFSIDDCIKGQFKSPYSIKAVESLKNAMKFKANAKAMGRFAIKGKAKAYSAAAASYVNTCLFIVEANRAKFEKKPLGKAAYEKIRSGALAAKAMLNFKTPVKVSLVP